MNRKTVMLAIVLLPVSLVVLVLAVVSVFACTVSNMVDYAGDRLFAFVDWFEEGLQ